MFPNKENISLKPNFHIKSFMRSGRLELPHPKIRVPKTRASTNSATTASNRILIE